MTAYAFCPPKGNPLMIDVLVEESLKYEKTNADKTVRIFDGVRIPIVSIDDLIKMKKKAGRPKDKLDLEQLIKLKNM